MVLSHATVFVPKCGQKKPRSKSVALAIVIFFVSEVISILSGAKSGLRRWDKMKTVSFCRSLSNVDDEWKRDSQLKMCSLNCIVKPHSQLLGKTLPKTQRRRRKTKTQAKKPTSRWPIFLNLWGLMTSLNLTRFNDVIHKEFISVSSRFGHDAKEKALTRKMRILNSFSKFMFWTACE